MDITIAKNGMPLTAQNVKNAFLQNREEVELILNEDSEHNIYVDFTTVSEIVVNIKNKYGATVADNVRIFVWDTSGEDAFVDVDIYYTLTTDVGANTDVGVYGMLTDERYLTIPTEEGKTTGVTYRAFKRGNFVASIESPLTYLGVPNFKKPEVVEDSGDDNLDGEEEK